MKRGKEGRGRGRDADKGGRVRERDVLALLLEPFELLVGARERTLILAVRLDTR